MYKINMMFMSRPKGDGTDAEVCFFVDVASDKSRVTIEERSMTAGEGATATITLPTEHYGGSSLAVSGLGVFDIHASANRSCRTDETGRPLGTDFRQYPALTMKSDAHPGTQWQVRSEDPGSLCYYLMESSRDQKSHKESLRVHAIYHYAGGHPHHPVDHSEGVLLLPDYQDSRNEMVSIALVFVLLWHMRELDVQQEKASLFKILGKLGIKKTSP
ncbi:hypothetical protein ColLi_11784 [Colletotrichum liriopes]|uniref:Uncharacterized protein n=1 Tax=Colletotrichum liriopes TaxID=708192 RepID=A0AA37LYT4_9PEZI|nr:hypothetical protein ColLi_11784 [Colletotrichum liriopes]